MLVCLVIEYLTYNTQYTQKQNHVQMYLAVPVLSQILYEQLEGLFFVKNLLWRKVLRNHVIHHYPFEIDCP